MADPVYKELSELPISTLPSVTDILHTKNTTGTDYQITFADLMARFTQNSNNLSDIEDAEIARNNLGVSSSEIAEGTFVLKDGDTIVGELIIDYAGSSVHVNGGSGQKSSVYATESYKATGIAIQYDGTTGESVLVMVQADGTEVPMFTFSEASPVVDFKTSPTVNGGSLVATGDNITWTDNHVFEQDVTIQGKLTSEGAAEFQVNPISTAPQSEAVNALTRRDFVESQAIIVEDYTIRAEDAAIEAEDAAATASLDADRAEAAAAIVTNTTISTIAPTDVEGVDGDVWWVIEP